MKPRVLVVDDEQDIRELLKFYLNKEGYEVIEAANGEEALTIFENEYIDLGIIDVMMPKMDGFELVESMKKTKSVKVLLQENICMISTLMILLILRISYLSQECKFVIAGVLVFYIIISIIYNHKKKVE